METKTKRKIERMMRKGYTLHHVESLGMGYGCIREYSAHFMDNKCYFHSVRLRGMNEVNELEKIVGRGFLIRGL